MLRNCYFIAVFMTFIYILSLQALVLFLLFCGHCSRRHKKRPSRPSHQYPRPRPTTSNPYTKTICMQLDNVLRARHKTCFLRPDTGPCRADIVQWYFDVKQHKCYRFFWGGCQGNGNRFETKKECFDHCHLNINKLPAQLPHFCSLAFDYGNCFGQFNRWGWDTFSKTCKRRLYSGCGGNQNNFESQADCMITCLKPSNNTVQQTSQFTTCVPFDVAGIL